MCVHVQKNFQSSITINASLKKFKKILKSNLNQTRLKKIQKMFKVQFKSTVFEKNFKKFQKNLNSSKT